MQNNTSANLLPSALKLASKGWHVFPLQPRGKKPLTSHGYKDASIDVKTIEAWFSQWPDANLGIATGASNLVVVDIDGPEGEAAFAKLQDRFGKLPNVLEVKTAKGKHLYFVAPKKRLKNSASKIGQNIDIRADGGYIVAPGSIHETGIVYEKADNGGALIVLPDWLAEIAEANANSPPAINTGPVASDLIRTGVAEGGRNDAITRIAGLLLSTKLDPLICLELCQCVNLAKFCPPLPDEEVIRTVDSIAAIQLQKESTK